jgi:hypothetical protein
MFDHLYDCVSASGDVTVVAEANGADLTRTYNSHSYRFTIQINNCSILNSKLANSLITLDIQSMTLGGSYTASIFSDNKWYVSWKNSIM